MLFQFNSETFASEENRFTYQSISLIVFRAVSFETVSD